MIIGQPVTTPIDLSQRRPSDWEYVLPPLEAPIATIVVSLDGALIPMADSDGYRETMVGTLSFYDPAGERQHTLYLAAAPEYGKQAFYTRLAHEITRTKPHYPKALYLGIADGAASNWSFLEQHTQRQLLDFFHSIFVFFVWLFLRFRQVPGLAVTVSHRVQQNAAWSWRDS